MQFRWRLLSGLVLSVVGNECLAHHRWYVRSHPLKNEVGTQRKRLSRPVMLHLVSYTLFWTRRDATLLSLSFTHSSLVLIENSLLHKTCKVCSISYCAASACQVSQTTKLTAANLCCWICWIFSLTDSTSRTEPHLQGFISVVHVMSPRVCPTRTWRGGSGWWRGVTQLKSHTLSSEIARAGERLEASLQPR